MPGPQRGVVPRVAPIGDRPALDDQQAIQVQAAGAADSDGPPIAIGVAGIAGHGRSRDLIRQGQGCLLATPSPLAGRTGAELAALGRINAVETDTDSVDLEGVAVDYAGYADDRPGSRRAGRGRENGQAESDTTNEAPNTLDCRTGARRPPRYRRGADTWYSMDARNLEASAD